MEYETSLDGLFGVVLLSILFFKKQKIPRLGSQTKWYSDLTTASGNLQSQINVINTGLSIKDFTDWITIPAGDYGSGVQRFTNANASKCKHLLFVLQQDNIGSDTIYEYIQITAPYSVFPSSYYNVVTSVGNLRFYYSNSGVIDLIKLPIRLRQIRYI